MTILLHFHILHSCRPVSSCNWIAAEKTPINRHIRIPPIKTKTQVQISNYDDIIHFNFECSKINYNSNKAKQTKLDNKVWNKLEVWSRNTIETDKERDTVRYKYKVVEILVGIE